jgi:hypothetical protein
VAHFFLTEIQNVPWKAPSVRQDDTTETQVHDTEGFIENAKTVLLENLPQDGGLVRIVAVWPTLSEELKNAIVKMIS